MTTNEFSNQFDVLYSNISSNSAPGLNEYEKSVFLTKAQEEIVKNYFQPAGNKYQQGFDGSPKRQMDFSQLVKIGEGTASTANPAFDARAKVYTLPEDLFLIINEQIITNKGTKQVIPLTFEEYTLNMSKPYKEPVKWQAWRLITTAQTSDDTSLVTSEIIAHTGETIESYKIRYVRRPRPIILVDLNDVYTDLTINGENTQQTSELNPIVHEEILQRAVELAKAYYTGDLNSAVTMGQRSE